MFNFRQEVVKMNDFRFSSSKQLNERLKQLNSRLGGEGTVYDDHQHLAIKIFNRNEVNIGRKCQKVKRLISQAKNVYFADVITPIKEVTVKGHFVGYTMRYVKDAKDLDYLAEKSFFTGGASVPFARKSKISSEIVSFSETATNLNLDRAPT